MTSNFCDLTLANDERSDADAVGDMVAGRNSVLR